MATDDPTPQDSAELAALRAENSALKTRLLLLEDSSATEWPEPVRRRRFRSFWAVLLIVVACLLAPLSVAAVWAKGEVTNTDRYVTTVAPLASDPAIQAAVTQRVTTIVMDALNVDELSTEALGAIAQNRDLTDRQSAALEALSGPITSGVTSLVESTVDKVITSETFETIWVEANRRAHSQLDGILSGSNAGGAVSIQGDALEVNVGEVVAKVKEALIADGLTVADKIPEVNTTVTLFESDNLSNVTQLQRAYTLLNTIGFWLPLLVAVLAITGIALAVSSRRAVIGFGIGFLISMASSALLLMLARVEYLNALPESVNQDAAASFFDTMAFFLRQSLWTGATAAVVLVLAGILTGPTRFARSIRGAAITVAAAVQRQLAEWGASLDTVRRWVISSSTGIRVGVVLIAAAIVVLQSTRTPALVLWVSAGLLVALFVIQILASDTEPEVADE